MSSSASTISLSSSSNTRTCLPRYVTIYSGCDSVGRVSSPSYAPNAAKYLYGTCSNPTYVNAIVS